MIENIIKNSYLEYMEEEIDTYARTYIMNRNNENALDSIDLGMYWIISKGLNSESWESMEQQNQALNYLWDKYNTKIETYHKIDLKHKETTLDNKAGFIR